MAKLIHNYLDKLEITKLKMSKDADKILKAINIDELLANPESYLNSLGKAFLDEHEKEIKSGFEQGQKFAEEILKKS